MYSCLETGWLNLPHPPLYSPYSFEDNPRCKHSLWATTFLLQRAIVFTPIAYELHVVWNRWLWVYLNRVFWCEVNPSTVGRIWLYLYQILLLHLDLLFRDRVDLKACVCVWGDYPPKIAVGIRDPLQTTRTWGFLHIYLLTSTQACRTMMLAETQMACQWKNTCWDVSCQHPRSNVHS